MSYFPESNPLFTPASVRADLENLQVAASAMQTGLWGENPDDQLPRLLSPCDAEIPTIPIEVISDAVPEQGVGDRTLQALRGMGSAILGGVHAVDRYAGRHTATFGSSQNSIIE